MTIDARCGPLVVNWVEADVRHRVAMPTVFGLLDDLTRAYVVDEGAAAFWTGDQVAVAIGYFEANRHRPVLVATGVLTDGVLASDSEIPKLDGAVCACRQKGVERFRISLRVRSFIEFDRMNMLEMGIIKNLNWLVLIYIVNHQIFIWSTNDSDVAW